MNDKRDNVVATTLNVDIHLNREGFYNICRTCTYVSKVTASKSTARTWANAHDSDIGDDGRAS